MGCHEHWKIHQKILVDQLVECVSNNCPIVERVEMGWDQESLRFSDKSQKAIDSLRVKCLRLHALVLRYVNVYFKYLGFYR